VCCPCAIQIGPFGLPYGLLFTTQGPESRQSAQPAYLSRFPNDPRTLDLVFAYGHFARDI